MTGVAAFFHFLPDYITGPVFRVGGLGEVQRIVLHPFPYLLWYQVDAPSVIVLACSHGQRSWRVI